MLIDTHAHLNLEPLYSNWISHLSSAKQVGVDQVIVPGTSIETSQISVNLANQNSSIWAAVGIHPSHLDNPVDLTQLPLTSQVVAIGECGLDYYHRRDNKPLQQQVFHQLVVLAQQKNLPLIIHTRGEGAIKDALQILDGYSKCVFHCFSGEIDPLRLSEASPGTYVGIGGTLTFKTNDQLRQAVRAIPLNRILLETDSPWLSPEPHRGKTNTPENVTIIALKLAEVLDLPSSQVISQTTINAKTLFNLS